MTLTVADVDITRYIDHTLLDPLASEDAIATLCDQAIRFEFPAVCVYPTHIKTAVNRLHQYSPQVCTVIGFPSGATTSAAKLYEAQDAADQGATELDVVINIGWLKAGNVDAVHQELANICATTGQTVKAILETTLLTDAEKRLGAEVSLDAGVAFLKTSTGWHGGATPTDIKLLSKVARDRVGVKASGGIRTLEQALALIAAGANRLGTSRGVDLVRMATAEIESPEPSGPG